MSVPRWFELLLRVLPPRFRDSYRNGIARLTARYADELRPAPRGLAWARAAADVLIVGASLRSRSAVGRTAGMGERMLNDVRFSVRALGLRPGFTVIAVATLAIGIGANTALYSVVNGVLLQPLPYAAADRIGILWHEFGEGAQDLPAVHALDGRDYRDRSELLEDLTIASGREWILGGADARSSSTSARSRRGSSTSSVWRRDSGEASGQATTHRGQRPS